MASAWIEHVKKVAQQKKISYREALKVAGASWKKVEKKVKAEPKKVKKEKKVKEEKKDKKEE